MLVGCSTGLMHRFGFMVEEKASFLLVIGDEGTSSKGPKAQ